MSNYSRLWCKYIIKGNPKTLIPEAKVRNPEQETRIRNPDIMNYNRNNSLKQYFVVVFLALLQPQTLIAPKLLTNSENS